MKRWLRQVCLCVALVTGILMMPQMTERVFAADCIAIEGENEENQNYIRWASPIFSYLTYDGKQTLMKVQAADDFEGVLVEYYDMNYQLLRNKVIPQELPIFGGFYETAQNYYLVTGQTNNNESANVEVFRVTKYDKSWNKIKSVGLYGCNTTEPFSAGSLRFAECGKWLLIRTSHEMYKSSDGLNHQANVTIQIDTENMVITDEYTKVMNSAYGYVSHSFNQFIAIENNKIVSLDHGDAYPRSLVLMKYPTDVTSGKFSISYGSYCENIDVMGFPGRIGENATGASAGALEVAETYYLVAGNSVIQDAQNTTRNTRNIFVSAVSKTSGEVTTRWFTNYAEGEETVSTPHMIKISDNQYLLMWTRAGKVHYVKVDGTGKQVGNIYSMEGNLSDCKPIIANGKVIWYIWEDETITFYQISISDFSETSSSQVVNGHRYDNQGVTNGYAKLKCSLCKEEKSVLVADSVSLWWNTDGGGGYSSWIDTNLNVNDKVYFWCSLSECDEIANELEIENSNPDVLEVKKTSSFMGEVIAKKTGTAQISFYPKYNPSAKQTITFSVYKAGAVLVTDVSVDSWYMDMNVGESEQLMVTVTPENATNKELAYTSSNPSVATVSDGGVITAKAAGETVITVTAKDGTNKSDEITVYVQGSANGSGTGSESMGESLAENGWYTAEDGSKYWYENGIRQGLEGRGKEIFDKDSDAWYWLDAEFNGKMAVSKDVYQESLAGQWGDIIGADGQRYGKWVRYDENGHMVKGWHYAENGIYFFDYIYGTMAKGYATIDGTEYYFNKDTGILEQTVGEVPEMGWKIVDGNSYWYEGYIRQGYSVDVNYRGKEIYDGESDAWYWLDNVDNGKKAVSKDVYQESLAGEWGDLVGEDGQRYGKWVRYDENGHMIKGWNENEIGKYFFDYTYGTMAKGHVTIDGVNYYFDENTGVLQ